MKGRLNRRPEGASEMRRKAFSCLAFSIRAKTETFVVVGRALLVFIACKLGDNFILARGRHWLKGAP